MNLFTENQKNVNNDVDFSRNNQDKKETANDFTFFATINLYSHRDVTNPSFRMKTNTSGKNLSVWIEVMFHNSCSIAVAEKGLQKKIIHSFIYSFIQSVSQSVSQSFNQPINQSINQLINQSI